MSDDYEAEGLRERLTKQGEDTLGKLAEDLMANPLVAGALQRRSTHARRRQAPRKRRSERSCCPPRPTSSA